MVLLLPNISLYSLLLPAPSEACFNKKRPPIWLVHQCVFLYASSVIHICSKLVCLSICIFSCMTQPEGYMHGFQDKHWQVLNCTQFFYRYLTSSAAVRGQRPASLRCVKPILVRAVRSLGFLLRSIRISSSNSLPSLGRQPVRTHTSFSSLKCTAKYEPWLHIRAASLSPNSWMGAVNLSAWNATCERGCKIDLWDFQTLQGWSACSPVYLLTYCNPEQKEYPL
jgi:hypothetical protein